MENRSSSEGRSTTHHDALMKTPRTKILLICCTFLLCSTVPVRAENWSGFRGPTGQGISTEKGLPLHWSDKENIAWRTPIPGIGWSSPIVHDDHVFLTSTTQKGVSCHVIAVDRRSGKILWNTKVFEQIPRKKRDHNSHATPTPVTDGRLVYAVFSAGSIAALDRAGKVVWTNHDIKHYSLHGLAASPILYDDLLIMAYDGSSDGKNARIGFKIPWQGAVILAVDKKTGKERWRGKRGPSRLGHVTPAILRTNGTTQLVSSTGDAIQGFDPDDGTLIWSVYSKSEGVAPSNAIGNGLVYTATGFEVPRIRVVRTDGKGEVTGTHIAWEQAKGVPMLASLLLVQPYLYTVTDKGVVTCYQAKSGDIVWQERIGGKHSSSPVYADGKIYFLSERDGESAIIEAGPEFKLIARNKINEKCKASAAFSQGNLFVRTEKNLIRIGASSRQTGTPDAGE